MLEKHADFLRDFRGDTVHPSTLEIFHELGLIDLLLERPHQKTERVSVTISGETFHVADFTKLRSHSKFIAMMPQWEFLDFVSAQAQALPNFTLLKSTESQDLIRDGEQIVGIQAKTAGGSISIHANLTVAADGRNSRLREASGLEVEGLGAPIDVFWMRVPRQPADDAESLGFVSKDGFLVLINRGDYWQCALPFAKGQAGAIRALGIEAFQQRIAGLAPMLADAAQTLTSWDDVKRLDVKVDHLQTWARDGLLCIGDAAHAMSPVGGIGINLAVQDAVATARLLGPVLKSGTAPSLDQLNSVQKRRAWPARMTQRAQVAIHKRILVPVLTTTKPLKAPLAVKLLNKLPLLRGLVARAIGLGLRPEHWHRNP